MRARNVISTVMFAGSLLALGGCGDKAQVEASNAGANTDAKKSGPVVTTKATEQDAQSKLADARREALDKAIADRIRAAFRADPELNTMAVDASVRDGAVTLHGTARNLARRERAAKLVAGIEGVRSVNNDLVILAGS